MNKLKIILIIVSAIALTGFGCRRPGAGTDDTTGSLVVWGLWQESEDVQPVIDAFEQQTGVKVEYKKIGTVGSYEKELLEALAEGRGPDIFVIHHTWVEGKRGLMAPSPSDIIDERALQEEFVDVVSKDVVRDGFIYALPTSVDTLALFYNKDLLSAAGIAQPPQNWQEFQRDVERLTKISRLGVIDQSAAAIGTAANVNRAPDILQLLIIQSGLSIVDEEGKVDIDSEIGERSLTFFTDFSNKSKKVFTWDLSQDFSIDAFSEGKTAMMINYSYHIPTIRAKNPRLPFAVAPAPQIVDSRTPRAFASYWPFAVSASSPSPRTAWLFLRFMTGASSSQAINASQEAPTARRDGIEAQVSDPLLGVFAEATLQAVTFPRSDIVATDAIFNTMIDDVVTGTIAIPDALSRTEDQLEQLNPQK